MSSALYSLGRWAYRARRFVVLAWFAVLVAVGALAVVASAGLDDEVTIPGTESQEALDQLAATFPEVSGASAQLVVVAPEGERALDDPAVRAPLEDATDRLADLDQVAAVTAPGDEVMAPAVSDDGAAVLVTIQLDGEQAAVTDATKEAIEAVADDLAAALPDGAVSALGGPLFSVEFPGVTIAEALGLLVALVVLVLTLGSFVAAGMPLLNALAGVGLSMGVLFAATALTPITSTTPLLALMLGLAVGIDYALFIVSRYRDLLGEGQSLQEAAARSVATAGSAVVFAGLTVMIALLGLGVAGIPFLTVMGVAAAGAVGAAVLVSLTLVPAMLSLAGERLRPKHAATSGRHAAGSAEGEEAATEAEHAEGAPSGPPPQRFFSAWVRGVTRRPVVTIAAVVAVLGIAAVPALNLRLALPDAGTLPADHQARIAYDTVAENFGDGFNGPLIVTGTIVTSTDPVGLMDALADELRDLPGVADVPLATPNMTADTGIVQVVPEGAPDSQATADLVHEIRALQPYFLDEYGVDLAVTGFTAAGIDISELLGAALVPFALVVVGLSLVLLTMVFRSIWVPVTATVGYLLSVGAAFGAVALVFEQGVLADLLHVTRTGPVISFMPIVLMGVLFGLAMDYQVFLVSRIREDYVHSGDALRSVTTGFLGSAKVVTAAALIMVAVFVAFVPEGDMNIKPIALGLAVGVAVDAFVVRMMLVPALLALLGERAWWMPRWLDRVLPSFDVEGEGVAHELALRDWPEPGARDALAAHELRLAGPEQRIVSVRVPDGGVLAVQGASPSVVSAFLLTVAGRLAPAAGTVKVAGLVLPVRAGAVRRHVAYVDVGADGLGALDEALAERPRILALDGVGALSGTADRAAVRDRLAGAHASGTALLVGSSGTAPIDVTPPGALVLDLDRPVASPHHDPHATTTARENRELEPA